MNKTIRRFFLLLILLGSASLFAQADRIPDFGKLREQNPKLNEFLTTEMGEYGGAPLRSYTAKAFDPSGVLWHSADRAIFWVTAKPPTTATPCTVGALILTIFQNDKWVVRDTIRFTASGKYNAAMAEISTGFSRPDNDEPVVTVTLSQGGRGYSYRESFTYSLEKTKFRLHRP
ncbi:MAG: hypothetical protein ABI615_07570 [Chthoniobacterales bacterium]